MFEKLRKIHPCLRFESYKTRRLDNRLEIEYLFKLEPDIIFTPYISIPINEECSEEKLDTLIFNLGLVELISYWKAACPPLIEVAAGPLSSSQIDWWKDLFTQGLSEFFFRNKIDSRSSNLLEIKAECPEDLPAPQNLPTNPESKIILVGGGKDSVVTLELFKNLQSDAGQEKHIAAFCLNPIAASTASIQTAGYTNVLTARRRIDPALLELNQKGYLNGHTPFSACLAFLGALTAAANGYKDVIASNESSASEPNLVSNGVEVNHRSSKSIRFEKRFREYCSRWLSPDINYYSALRPLSELQICSIFSKHSQHFSTFRSCNRNQQKNSWCGHCPKCAFVALCLAPFISEAELESIFEAKVFTHQDILEELRALLGLTGVKPFECVGSREESQAAFALLIEKFRIENSHPPNGLASIWQELNNSELKIENASSVLQSWDSENFLPEEFQSVLRKELSSTYLSPALDIKL